MAEDTSQDENIKNSELTIARLQQKVLGHGSRCPVLLRLGRMEFLLGSDLYMKLSIVPWLSMYEATPLQEHTMEEKCRLCLRNNTSKGKKLL